MQRVTFLLATLACACSNPQPAVQPPPTSASASAAVPAELAAASASAPAPSAAAPASAIPAAVSAPAPAPSASAPTPEPGLPDVTVANIGMHIGGGPNDAATKEPIKLSVEPHFGEFKRCWAQAESSKPGDVGVDLKIGKDGGKAKVTEPRTAIKGAGFKDCVVRVFESIEFRKPRKGDTVVSYSLRFTPGAAR